MQKEMRHEIPEQKDAPNLLLFLGSGGALALALWWLTGPPTLPSFDLGQLSEKLSGSEVSSEDAVSVASLIAWAALIYLGTITFIQLALAFTVKVTDGATWAATAQQFANLVTLPPMRRMVNAAVVGALVVGIWKERGDASAATTQPVLIAHVAAPMLTTSDARPSLIALSSADLQIPYSVSQGESSWSIARRLYGDGTQYVTLFRANHAQEVAAGVRWAQPEPLHVGWTIGIPLPAPNLWSEEDRTLYRVQSDDSLWRIAESFLGSGFRWTDIWDLNQGRAMNDDRTFSNPDLIIPGWVLELPVEATIAPPQEPDPGPPPIVEPPIEEPWSYDPPEPEPTWPAELDVPVPGASDPQPEAPRGGSGDPSLPWPGELPVLKTAAGLAVLAPVYLLVRALRRRQPTSPRASITWDDRKQARGDLGRVVLAARALMAALRDEGFDETRLTLVREAGRYQDCELRCPPGDAEAIERQRYELARRLFCGVDVEISSETEIRIRLSRFQRLAGLLDESSSDAAVMLVPVGGLDSAFYYLNVAAHSTVLLSGTREQTAQLTASWVQTLAATCSPEAVSVLIDDELAAGGSGWSDSRMDPTILRSEHQLLAELEDMVIARENADSSPQVAVLAVMPFGDAAFSSRIETLYHRARECRITLLLVATDQIEMEPRPAGGAVLAFADSILAQEIDGWDGEGELVLVADRRAPLSLYGTEVRRDVLSVSDAKVAKAPQLQDEAWENEVYDESGEDNDREGEDVSSEPSDDEHHRLDYWQDQDGNEVDEEAAESEEVVDRASPDSARNGVNGTEAPAWLEPLGADNEDAEAPSHETNGSSPPVAELTDSFDAFAATERQLLLGIRGGTSEANEAEARPLFQATCLGQFDVSAGGESLKKWRVAKSRELLALLLAHKNGRVSREAAIEALWPDALPEQTEALLTDTMYRLRKALRAAAGSTREEDIVTSRHQQCLVDLALFRVDLRAFDAHLSRAAELERGDALVEYEQAFSLYRGDLFGSEPFEWAAPYRQEYRDRFVSAARRAGVIALECRDTARAVEFFRLVLEREPIDEEAARGLMRAYARRADLHGVRKTYKVLCEALRRDLEDETARPLPDTEVLFAELTRDSIE